MKVFESPDNWRYERKFFISHADKHLIESVVKMHPAMFSELFYKRKVNNIYFDTYALTNFFKSVDGQSSRLKVRIRWYGDLYGDIEKPVLELKIKNGLLGAKLSYRLKRFSVDKKLSDSVIKEVIESSDLPEEVKDLMRVLNMSLLNSYTRKYYQSQNKVYRITIDTDMKFIEVLPHFNSFSNELNDKLNTVMELKYEPIADDDAGNITRHFPFRMTKSSKYVTGVEHILSTIY